MAHGKRIIGSLTFDLIQNLSIIILSTWQPKTSCCIINSEDILSIIELVIHLGIDLDPVGAFQEWMSWTNEEKNKRC
jgi:hypothetical protein